MYGVFENQICNGFIHDATEKSVKYALDRLIELGKIPRFDTVFYSLLWTQSMFSSAVIWMSYYFNGEPLEFSATQYNITAERLVEMTMNGKIPDNTR